MRGSGVTLSVDGRGSSYLAVQDGPGPWRPLAGDAEHTLKLTDPAGRYGLLSVCAEGNPDDVSGNPNGNLSVNVQHNYQRARVYKICRSKGDMKLGMKSACWKLNSQ